MCDYLTKCTMCCRCADHDRFTRRTERPRCAGPSCFAGQAGRNERAELDPTSRQAGDTTRCGTSIGGPLSINQGITHVNPDLSLNPTPRSPISCCVQLNEGSSEAMGPSTAELAPEMLLTPGSLQEARDCALEQHLPQSQLVIHSIAGKMYKPSSLDQQYAMVAVVSRKPQAVGDEVIVFNEKTGNIGHLPLTGEGVHWDCIPPPFVKSLKWRQQRIKASDESHRQCPVTLPAPKMLAGATMSPVEAKAALDCFKVQPATNRILRNNQRTCPVVACNPLG